MNDLSATICAIATPPGEGGIAVVRLRGLRPMTLRRRCLCL